MALLTLKIIGIPEEEVRGNIRNEILKEIIEEKGLRFKKERKKKTYFPLNQNIWQDEWKKNTSPQPSRVNFRTLIKEEILKVSS